MLFSDVLYMLVRYASPSSGLRGVLTGLKPGAPTI